MYCMRRHSSHDYWIILCIAHWNCISVSVHVIFYFEVLLAFMFIFENESRISLSSHNTGQTNHPVSFLFKKTITSYPASRGYIFAVWAVLRKVASADNHSILYRACAKFVTRFASKNRKKKTRFLIYSSRFLDGFEGLSAEATFRTPAHTAKMYPLLAG